MSDEKVQSTAAEPKVSILPISQATTATFTDLYFRLTFFFFIQTGSKRVLSPTQGELIGQAGDLMIFPPGSMVTMENRPVLDDSYRAVGVSFSDDLIDAVFADHQLHTVPKGIQIVRAEPDHPSNLLDLITATLADDALPPSIQQHRLLEPLIWLRDKGYQLPTHSEERPLSRLRRLIETDLSHPWRISEVASHFAMSEATLRRLLVKSGQGFAKTLLNTRLEHGLSMLQTTNVPVSQIALDCGFKTPSHFSDAFRKRFEIRPKDIRTAAT
ncbi:MAG: AraC family transcriptional regulator [Sulfitobacter sp.]